MCNNLFICAQITTNPMKQVNITRIELINGEKILSSEVNRTIDKNQLERFRRLIKFNQSKKFNKKIDVMFTYSEVS